MNVIEKSSTLRLISEKKTLKERKIAFFEWTRERKHEFFKMLIKLARSLLPKERGVEDLIGSCPLRVTKENLIETAKDPRFAYLTEDQVPPRGLCIASPDSRHLQSCGRKPEHCTTFRDQDLCQTNSFGGDTYTMGFGTDGIFSR